MVAKQLWMRQENPTRGPPCRDHAFPRGAAGIEVNEIAPITEGAEQWQGLRVTFTDQFASQCKDQDFFFGPNLLIRRHDYHVAVAGYFRAAQYIDRIVDVLGIKMPTRLRAYLRGPDSKPLRNTF
jgi:hypothetical protein